MIIQNNREDLSRFLVHLTRDYDDQDASTNLIGILKDRTIYARNAHCLVMHKIKQMGFTSLLQSKFYTACFTETPLTQIRQLAGEIEGRKIQLKPYGLVFWKDQLFENGSSPAIYINAKGTSISKYLIDEFEAIFREVTTLKKLRRVEATHYENIVHYYSLINVVRDQHDFLWEREWRHHGDFTFNYRDIVAIIANNPGGFEKLCERKLSKKQCDYIKKLPIINPSWTYEELIEKFAVSIWNKLS